MKIDLKQDLKKVELDLASRVKNYGRSKKGILGKSGDPIRLITLGFSYDQSGSTAIVFDTRPDAAYDGEWTNCDRKELEFNHWTQAIDDLCENESKLDMTLHDGSRRTFKADFEQTELAECFGLMCRAALESAWKKGLFAPLPLAEECQLAVEDFAGFYGWTSDEPAYITNEKAAIAELQARAARLSKQRRIEFWIAELECLATERPCLSAQILNGDKFVIKELFGLGRDGIVSMLKWANKLALKPEFRDPATKKKGEDIHYRSTWVLSSLFKQLRESRIKSDEIEQLVRSYITRALKTPKFQGRGSAASREKKTLDVVSLFPAAMYLNECYGVPPQLVKKASGNRPRSAKASISGKKRVTRKKRSTRRAQEEITKKAQP